MLFRTLAGLAAGLWRTLYSWLQYGKHTKFAKKSKVDSAQQSLPVPDLVLLVGISKLICYKLNGLLHDLSGHVTCVEVTKRTSENNGSISVHVPSLQHRSIRSLNCCHYVIGKVIIEITPEPSGTNSRTCTLNRFICFVSVPVQCRVDWPSSLIEALLSVAKILVKRTLDDFCADPHSTKK